MKNMKKLLAALILICVLSPVLPSCKSGGETGKTPDADDERLEGAEPDSGDEKPDIPDNLEARDFGGKKFVIATRDDSAGPTCRHVLEVYAEADIGEVLNDAVYKRNMTIEERFNCRIEPLLINEKDESTLTRDMQKSVRSGDFFADVAIGHMINMSAAALQNLFYNWYDVPNIDFSKPWWNESATKELQVAGISFFAFSDMLISGYDCTYAIAFNKKLCADFGIAENPYDIVNAGKWTIDKLYEITKNIYTDLNGDGKSDDYDLYGFVSNAYSAAAAWPWAFDHFVTRRNAEGYPELALNNEKSAQITSKMYDYFYNTPGWSVMNVVQRDDKMWWDYVRSEMFPENRAVFATFVLADTLLCKSMEADFGLLPMPKWDEKQDKYYTMLDGHGPLMAIPTTSADNTEMIGTIMEVLAAESYKQVIPAYYEIAFKNKQLRDEESIQMLDDYIKPGVLFDFGFIYDGWQGFAFWLQNILQPQKSEFASYYESKEKAVTKYYDKVIAAHENYTGG
ncbi:MAG: hypothetical protein FWD23_00540 [Oscillospiraceae bacterium]|nr:hypothetical protein [Oscillospiraceae bacterium]